MSDIINLKQFKKRKNRTEKQHQADANRILFGRTKVEKVFAETQNLKNINFLEQNRLETPQFKPDTHLEDAKS